MMKSLMILFLTIAPLHFRAGTPVQVFIDSAFPAALYDAIREAFQAWQAHPGNDTGITFTFSTAPRAPHGRNVFVVTRAQPDPALSELGETTFDAIAQRAYTKLSPALTSVVAVRNTMAHEIGHALGLPECDQCSADASVMAGVPVRGNVNASAEYGLGGPTAEDMARASALTKAAALPPS